MRLFRANKGNVETVTLQEPAKETIRSRLPFYRRHRDQSLTRGALWRRLSPGGNDEHQSQRSSVCFAKSHSDETSELSKESLNRKPDLSLKKSSGSEPVIKSTSLTQSKSVHTVYASANVTNDTRAIDCSMNARPIVFETSSIKPFSLESPLSEPPSSCAVISNFVNPKVSTTNPAVAKHAVLVSGHTGLAKTSQPSVFPSRRSLGPLKSALKQPSPSPTHNTSPAPKGRLSSITTHPRTPWTIHSVTAVESNKNSSVSCEDDMPVSDCPSSRPTIRRISFDQRDSHFTPFHKEGLRTQAMTRVSNENTPHTFNHKSRTSLNGNYDRSPSESSTVPSPLSRQKEEYSGHITKAKSLKTMLSSEDRRGGNIGSPHACPGFDNEGSANELLRALTMRRLKTIQMEKSWAGVGALDEDSDEDLIHSHRVKIVPRKGQR